MFLFERPLFLTNGKTLPSNSISNHTTVTSFSFGESKPNSPANSNASVSSASNMVNATAHQVAAVSKVAHSRSRSFSLMKSNGRMFAKPQQSQQQSSNTTSSQHSPDLTMLSSSMSPPREDEDLSDRIKAQGHYVPPKQVTVVQQKSNSLIESSNSISNNKHPSPTSSSSNNNGKTIIFSKLTEEDVGKVENSTMHSKLLVYNRGAQRTVASTVTDQQASELYYQIFIISVAEQYNLESSSTTNPTYVKLVLKIALNSIDHLNGYDLIQLALQNYKQKFNKEPQILPQILQNYSMDPYSYVLRVAEDDGQIDKDWMTPIDRSKTIRDLAMDKFDKLALVFDKANYYQKQQQQKQESQDASTHPDSQTNSTTTSTTTTPTTISSHQRYTSNTLYIPITISNLSDVYLHIYLPNTEYPKYVAVSPDILVRDLQKLLCERFGLDKDKYVLQMLAQNELDGYIKSKPIPKHLRDRTLRTAKGIEKLNFVKIASEEEPLESNFNTTSTQIQQQQQQQPNAVVEMTSNAAIAAAIAATQNISQNVMEVLKKQQEDLIILPYANDASTYTEFRVVKVNKLGVRQERILGFDGNTIFNHMPPTKQQHGFLGIPKSNKTKHPERPMETLVSVHSNENSRQFSLEYSDGETVYYEAKTLVEAEEIVKKLKTQMQLKRASLRKNSRGSFVFQKK